MSAANDDLERLRAELARAREEFEVQRALADAFDEVAGEKAAVVERVKAIHWPRKVTTTHPDGSTEAVIACASSVCGAWPCETGRALAAPETPGGES